MRANVGIGEFGAWEKTGRLLNLGLLVGAYRGLGYGASIGALIADEGLDIPARSELAEAAHGFDRDADRASAAIDLRAGCPTDRRKKGRELRAVETTAASWRACL